MVVEPLVQELSPPSAARQESRAQARPSSRAPMRSRTALNSLGARAVKKSTTMLPRCSWHSGMNRPTAAPVARPTSSKSPVMVRPTVSRPAMLSAVSTTMKEIRAPASRALSRASRSSIVMDPAVRTRPHSAVCPAMVVEFDARTRRASGDANAQFAQARHAAHERVAGHYRGHALGRAGEDQVARLQFPRGGKVFDRLADIPDQLRHVAALAVLAVHLQRDVRVRHVAGLRRGRDRADRRRLLESLADAPGPALLLHLALQVAACHVQADGITPDVALHVGGLDVLAA